MQIGELTIQMAADLARLRGDMAEASRLTGSTMAGIERAAGAATAAIGAIGIGFSAAAMAQSFRRVVDELDALNDVADATGASIAKIAGLQQVAARTGTAIDVPTTALIKLNKTLTDLSPTSGGALVLRQLGLDAAVLRQEDPADALVAVARAFNKFEDDGGKARAMMELLGKSMREAAPLMHDLAERGSDVSPAVEEAAKQAEKFNQALAALHEHSAAVARSLVGELLPAANAVLEKLATRGFGGTLLEALGWSDKDTANAALHSRAKAVIDLNNEIKLTSELLRADPMNAAADRWKQQLADAQTRLEAAKQAFRAADAMLNSRPGSAAAAPSEDGPKPSMGPPIDPAAIRAAEESLKKYHDLIAKIRELTSAQIEERTTGRAVTEAYKAQTEVSRLLADSKLKVGERDRGMMAAALEALRVEEVRTTLAKDDKKARDDRLKAGGDELARLKQQIDAQRQANDEVGRSAIAVAMLAAARLEEKAAAADEQAFWSEGSSLGDAVTQGYRDQAAALRELAELKRAGAVAADELRLEQERARIVDQYLQRTANTDYGAGFDKAGAAMGTFLVTLQSVVKAQDAYNAAKASAVGNAERLAQVEAQHQAEQVRGFGDMVGAAKGFVKESTAGYRVLGAAEKAFRAYEMASAVQANSTKLSMLGDEVAATVSGVWTKVAAVFGGQEAETAAVTAGEAERNAAKTPGVFMAFMSALGPWGMAAAGLAVAAVLGARGGAFDSGGFASRSSLNDGTGTVLGDPTAKSESITKAIEMLRDVDTMTMRYSAQMLASLQSIEAAISGVTTLLARSGGIESAVTGIQTGAIKADGLQGEIGRINHSISAIINAITPIGGTALTGVMARDTQKLFGSSQSIVGQGIYGGPQSLADIASHGFQASYYADVEQKSRFLGLTASTRLSTQYVDAGAELEQQFSLILGGFVDAVKAASTPLGIALSDVEERLNRFVVDIKHIDLQGLSSDEINERLTAIFGAAGDRIAQAALGGFEDFQRIGEGYLETVVRVASGVEEARIQLQRLSIDSIKLADVLEKQGDVAAELVRQSIAAAEGLTGIADIINTMDGKASEIAETYKALTDIRTSLKLLGMDGKAVTFELLQGAGGLQALTDSLASFEEKFLTPAQQNANNAARMSQEFERLGFALPKTADDFVALVKSIDTSSASGQQLLGSLLGLSSGFADLLDAIHNVGQGIEDEINRIKGLTGTDPQSLAQLQANFAIQSASARAGNQTAIDALPGLSQALLDAADKTAGSALDVSRIRSSVLTSLEQTLAIINDPTRLLKGVPGFADGGTHAGGWRVVGERGPELEATGSARYFDADETQAILNGAASGSSNADLLAELQALRAEIAGFRQESQIGDAAIAGNTGKQARLFERAMGPNDALRITTDGTDPIQAEVV